MPATGQAWTTLSQAQASGKFQNVIRQQYPKEPHIYTIQTQTVLGIGQRCFLIRTPKGNILWDCLAYIDDDTVKAVSERLSCLVQGLGLDNCRSTLWVEWMPSPSHIRTSGRPT